MLVVHYSIIYIDIKQQEKLKSEHIFLDLANKNYNFANTASMNLTELIALNPNLKNRTYQILFIDREKLSHIINNYANEEEKKRITFNLPPKIDNVRGKIYSYKITNQKLNGWLKLETGEQIAIDLYHRPITINFSSMMIWFPILAFFFLCIYALSHFLIYMQLWDKSLTYANKMSSPNKSRKYNTYQTLNFENLATTEEFARLGHALNRANYQLHSRERRLNSLLLRFERSVIRAPLPIAFIRCNGVINYINERFSYVFMVSLTKEQKLNINNIVEASDKQSDNILQNLAEQKITRNINVVGRKNKQNYQMHIMPWFANSGQIQGFTLMLNNISQVNKQLTNNIKQINEQSARIADFERLWSVMGHELRTPLSGIIGMLELLKDENLSLEQQETFDTLEQTSQTMLFMLNDMLDLAKMDASKLQLSISQTDIVQMCRQVCDLMIGNARRQGIELLLFFEPTCVQSIATDEARLRQVLLNLVSNAIKFTHSGYVTLRVSVASIEKLKNSVQKYLYFEVIDTGIGISEQEKGRLFSYFNQANNSISRNFGGTGLGLAISKNFVQMLGGEILLESEVQKGSNFKVKLPISQKNHQLVYQDNQYNQKLNKIHLITFTSQSISKEELSKVYHYLGLSASIYDSLDKKTIEQINVKLQQLANNITPILLIEHEIFNNFKIDNQLDEDTIDNELVELSIVNNLLRKLTSYQNMPKILLSMLPERSLSNQLLDSFDSHLTKPLSIDFLLAELIHLTEQKKTGINQISKLQHSFNEFFAQLDNDKNTQNNHITIENNNSSLILIAEDNPVNLKVLSKILEKLGYQFISTNNGQKAVDILKERRREISLILMDCRMPIMSGLEATRQIRANKDSIPIIALTANDTDEDRKNCLSAGMDNFLSKPIKRSALKAMLEKYMIR
ncbi:MAG: response regulator [Moraxellaceae bacterium]|nr:response regulator [Moraxellaceae bacterium]